MKYLFVLVLCTVLYSCKKDIPVNTKPVKPDTLVIRKIMSNKYDFNKKEILYKLVVKDDTAFTNAAAFQRTDGAVRLFIALGDGRTRKKNTTLYRNRLIEAKRLLKEIRQDFKTDSINSLYIGYLIKIGDPAIAITKEYHSKYGDPGDKYWLNLTIKERQRIDNLITNSQLNNDLNLLLAPYGKRTGEFTMEKILFERKHVVINSNNLETKESEIPERVLDCGLDFRIINK